MTGDLVADKTLKNLLPVTCGLIGGRMNPSRKWGISIFLVLLTILGSQFNLDRKIIFAQSPTPTIIPTPTLDPTPTGPLQPPPNSPVLTPTRTGPEIVGEPFEWVSNVWQRFGWWTIGIIVVVIAFLVLKGAFEGFVDSIKKRAEKLGTATIDKLEHRADDISGIKAYLKWMCDELEHLPVIPVKSSERQVQLPLKDVYIPLRVVRRTQMHGFRRLTLGDFDPAGEYRMRQEAFEAIKDSEFVYQILSKVDEAQSDKSAFGHKTFDKLLLVGDAGSGKTTTLQFGALVLAQDFQQATTDSARRLLNLNLSSPLLPIYVRLTLVATYVRESYERAKREDLPKLHGAPSSLLVEWLDNYTNAQIGTKQVATSFELLSQQLTHGQCLVLLDGLDETGDTQERDYIQRLIINLTQDYPNNFYIVASRPFEELHLLGFEERHLSPLDNKEMQRLLKNWFGAVLRREDSQHVEHEPLQDQVSYLWRTLQENPRLFEMGTNPLLLTSMALLVHTGVGLPRERAELYNRLVYLLLETWRILQVSSGIPKRDHARPMLYGGEESTSSVQRRLQELAAWMQENRRREVRLIEVQDLFRSTYKKLMGWNGEKCDDYIKKLLESLALDSGLIQHRDSGYSFAHYTLQEYLTARAYDQRVDSVDALFRNWKQARWHEPILLAVGHWATSGEPSKAQNLLRKLLDTEDTRAVVLAGEALYDADADRVLELAPLRSETASRLNKIAFSEIDCPDPRIRNRAASFLDLLGHKTQAQLDLQEAAYWAKDIEPGSFVMGDEMGQFENEKPAFIAHTSYRYSLARYPVTNKQYKQFLDYLDSNGKHDEANKRRPRSWLSRHYRAGEGNHPVVNVSWKDACAFAKWVHALLHDSGELSSNEVIRLPSELEWERAAAYPTMLTQEDTLLERREYPWGHSWAKNNTSSADNEIPANTYESGILSTSIVGIFPNSAADCSAEDMVGNVWEWCITPYSSYPVQENAKGVTYAIRGGSWHDPRSLARCASRNDMHPDETSNFVGFRLARAWE